MEAEVASATADVQGFVRWLDLQGFYEEAGTFVQFPLSKDSGAIEGVQQGASGGRIRGTRWILGEMCQILRQNFFALRIVGIIFGGERRIGTR